MKKTLACGVCVAVVAAAFAVPRAERLAKVDAEGVMRWTDDGRDSTSRR